MLHPVVWTWVTERDDFRHFRSLLHLFIFIFLGLWINEIIRRTVDLFTSISHVFCLL